MAKKGRGRGPRRSPRPPKKQHEIMLYRAGFLGDILLTNAAVRAIRRRNPRSAIVYQCWPQYDSAIAADPHITGVARVGSYKYEADKLLDFRHELQPNWDTEYWGKLLYEQAKDAGLAGRPDETYRPHVYMLPDSVADKADDTRLCIVHGWSQNGQNWRMWSHEKWNELILRLCQAGWVVVQVGGDDDPLFEEVYDLRGRTHDLMDLYGIFAVADLVVCIDSAMQHISGAEKFIRQPEAGKLPIAAKGDGIQWVCGANKTILLNGPMNPACIVAPDSATTVVSCYDHCGNYEECDCDDFVACIDECECDCHDEHRVGRPCNHSFGTEELPICEWGNACMQSITVNMVWEAICKTTEEAAMAL